MAVDGFGAFVGNVPAAIRRSLLELHRRLRRVETRLIGQEYSNTQTSVPVSTKTYLTVPIDATLEKGRLYRMSFHFRAVARQDNADLPISANIVLHDNTTSLGWIDTWHTFGQMWTHISGYRYVEGDDVARSYRLACGGCAAALYIFPTVFSIEDVGPA